MVSRQAWATKNEQISNIRFINFIKSLFNSPIWFNYFYIEKKQSIFQRKIHNEYTIFCFDYSMIHKSQWGLSHQKIWEIWVQLILLIQVWALRHGDYWHLVISLAFEYSHYICYSNKCIQTDQHTTPHTMTVADKLMHWSKQIHLVH